MSAFAEDNDRRLIPRWRYADQVSFSHEFSGDPRLYKGVEFDRQYLEEKLTDWNQNRSNGTAIDLLSCGIGGGWVNEVRSAAKYLSERQSALTPQAINLVERALAGVANEPPNTGQLGLKFAPDTFSLARARVADARKKIHKDPRNALAWLDFARGQAILGHKEQATLATQRALYLAPHHRHTLRAAARYFIHVEEPDRAHSLLMRNPRTAADPWLMAAEISVARIAERSPRFVRAARRLVEARQLPIEHLTELYSALGTHEYYSGAERRARKFMRASLQAPNDNTVAQARWIRTKLSGLPIQAEAFRLPLSFEARCWHSLETSHWEQAREECLNWLYDEPYSSRPAQVGSYIGVSLTSDHAFAEASARAGLRADPNDASLRNNLTVALAYQGKTTAAIEHFAKIKLPLPEYFPLYVYFATTGLLHFRVGDIETGRELYAKAEQRAPFERRGRVAIFQAREELCAQTKYAHESVERARQMNERAQLGDSNRLLELLEKQVKDCRVNKALNACETDLKKLHLKLAPIVRSSNAVIDS